MANNSASAVSRSPGSSAAAQNSSQAKGANNESRGCCSCCGRMWNYIKEHAPSTAKICAVALIRFLCIAAAVAGSITLHVGITAMAASPMVGLCILLPAAFALAALANIVANAVTHALGWDEYRTRLLGPTMPFIVFT